MKQGLFIQHNVTIPEHELEITASRAGGPGGQHVNKTSSRITVRWHVPSTHSMPEYLKNRILQKLASQITSDGFIVVHNSASRSQQQNKEAALHNLASIIRNALKVPKKRIPTAISASTHATRLEKKAKRGTTKKLRQKKIIFDD